MEKEVRVRYAPSPTGFLHIGGARSALFNYLYAKRYNGKFVFRSEDTDVERNVKGGEESQYKDLLWLGIVPDESPFEPNPKYAPYRQTERLDIYQKYADELLAKGLAYYCYCTEEEIEERKNLQLENGAKTTKYDGKCAHLTKEQIEAYKAEGRKPCIRIALPKNHTYEFDDLVRGHMKFSSEDLGGDFVIVKSNGIPTYNFAVAIDDHLMDITHVLRGEEHLSNTPKQLAVYEALNWEAPRFGHMTIIINSNGKKLSKRDLNVLQFMSQYREQGYLKDAIFNFILLLGWNGKDNKEIYSFEEAVEAFNPAYLSSAPSTFDVEKMKWMNSQYIKKLTDAEYLEFIKPFIEKVVGENTLSDQEILRIGNMFKEELNYGLEIVEPLKSIINNDAELTEEQQEMISRPVSKDIFKKFSEELNNLEEINKDSMKQLFKTVTKELGVKGKDFYMPIRLKLTSVEHGIELYNIISILGKEKTIERLLK